MFAINVRVVYGKCSKKENHDVFGFTYIKAEPEENTKPNNNVETKHESRLERARREIQSGKLLFKFAN